jgi:hypothetical protein
MGEWRLRSAQSELLHWIEVSGQLRAPRFSLWSRVPNLSTTMESQHLSFQLTRVFFRRYQCQATSQKIFRLLCKTNVYYCVYNVPQLYAVP